MNIWLFSSGDGDENEDVDQDLFKQIGSKQPLLTFIPSAEDDYEEYYDEFIDRFQRHGLCQFRMLDVDRPISNLKLKKVLQSDLIYLSGGNTYYFLKHLHDSGFMEELHKFIKRGGILAGHSAGAIIQTPHIATAGFPEDDRDDNEVGIIDLTAMGLVQFEIFPHYENSAMHNQAIRNYTRNCKNLVYAVSDGSAIHATDLKLSFYGEVYAFFNGQKISVDG